MNTPADPAASSRYETLSTAHALADLAREISLRWFRRPIAVELKSDASPVTQADREVEAAMRALLVQRHPGHGIDGEEHGVLGADRPFVWTLDPIDGTKSFICGLPLWGTLIALLQGGHSVLGLIDMPVLGERWVAWRGDAAWYVADGQAPVRCSTSGCPELGAARLCAPSPDALGVAGRRAFDSLANRTALVRHGGDCYAGAMLASGHLDLLLECGLGTQDFLPMVAVVEVAGGTITDWQGRPLGPRSSGEILVAATAALHAQALAVLAASQAD
ncbi:MAG: histidinol-phosphatase [Pseudomonadota bacterium]|jgi:inositol-phosphate phosphatase / L-galactose 1-phosphate phosphatase / histidinol-phosphatase